MFSPKPMFCLQGRSTAYKASAAGHDTRRRKQAACTERLYSQARKCNIELRVSAELRARHWQKSEGHREHRITEVGRGATDSFLESTK